MIYYVAGIPYSDELYHHGIKGQKWGVRRFQNLDRTLTALGKIRYGAGKVAETAGKAAKATGKAVAKVAKSVKDKAVTRYKRKHINAMTDQELREYTNRLNMEAAYKEAKKRNRGPVRKVVGDILQKAGNKIVDRALNEMTNKIFDKPDKTTDYEAVLKDPKKFSDKEVADATKRMANINAMEKMSGSSAKSDDKASSKPESKSGENNAKKESVLDKVYTQRYEKELEANKAEARAKADAILAQRERTAAAKDYTEKLFSTAKANREARESAAKMKVEEIKASANAKSFVNRLKETGTYSDPGDTKKK